MPQVDRLLSALATSRGDAVELLEGEPASFLVGGTRRPVTRQALTGSQLLAFLREIAPVDASSRLDAGQPADFRYASPDGPFDVQVTRVEQRWSARLAPAMVGTPAAPVLAGLAVPGGSAVGSSDGVVDGFVATAYEGAFGSAPAGPAVRIPADAPATPASPVAAVAAPAAPRANVGGDRAHMGMDRLLRILVERGGSDLHLRVGEPPIVRASGHLERLDEAPLDGAGLEAMMLAIMPDRNRAEYAERNDTDYAYEIDGVARFRANALRDRLGPAGVFRVIPATVVS
ncbi:MAG: hypothetical protein ACXW61_17970, partial [Gemmatirosa sp.]